MMLREIAKFAIFLQTNFDELYNSVAFDPRDMNVLMSNLKDDVIQIKSNQNFIFKLGVDNKKH